jgi:3-phenylpropionate/cinnamic acid dioxygenase small subunit
VTHAEAQADRDLRELQQLVIREARLLDDWQLDDWLALFDDKATYWVPIDDTVDPHMLPSIIFEERSTLAMRVEQLMRQKRIAQSPRSELLHQVTNAEFSLEGDGAAVRYNLVVFEVRAGDWRQSGLGNRRYHAGICRMRFVRRGPGWLIAEKIIRLLDRELPQEGFSYLL